MKENKFTKGKWEVKNAFREENDHLNIKSNELIKVSVEGRAVALCGHNTSDEAQSNAKLIAAAPELLEALQNILNHNIYIEMRSGKSELSNILKNGQKAINKALGE